MLGIEVSKVSLSLHDDDWANQFLIIKEELIEILGSNVVEIYHIGSTAIKNIVAKPILDVAVVVKDIQSLMEAMKTAGYELVMQRDPGRYCFSKLRNDNIDTHHVHCFLENHEKLRSMILFCKYLNEHPKYAKQYNDLKTDLAAKYPNDRNSYGEGKSEFINMILDLNKNPEV